MNAVPNFAPLNGDGDPRTAPVEGTSTALIVVEAETQVLSADSTSPAYIKDAQRRAHVCVISKGGKVSLLWSKDHVKHGDPWFSSYRQSLKNNGINAEPLATDLAEIHAYYRQSADDGEQREASNTTDADAEERSIALLRTMADLRASDMRVITGRGLAYIRYRRNGRGYHLQTMEEAEGEKIANVLYGAFCTQIDGNGLDKTAIQDAAIDPSIAKKHGVPEGRIATHPKDANGLQMTIRVQPKGNAKHMPLDEQGFLPAQIATYDDMIRRGSGLVLVSGPVGSGKSTTLIAMAERMSDYDDGRDIITIEDPIEYRAGAQYKNIMQLPKKAPWHEEISSMARQAPDVLMPSELRGREAAQAAVDLASIGPMVMTTVHTNDTFTITRRLIRSWDVDMDTLLDPQMLTGLVHLRLATRLCRCKIALADFGVGKLDAGLRDRLLAGLDGDLTGVYLKNPEGCTQCRENESGRISVGEVCMPSMHVVRCLEKKRLSNHKARQQWVKEEGGITKTQHLLHHIKNGIVCPIYAERSLWALDLDAELEKVL